MSTSVNKRTLTPAGIARLLTAAGVDASAVTATTPITTGTYNTIHRVSIPGDADLVLKVPPHPDAPCLTYEQGILRGEDAYFRLAAPHAPVPGIRYADLDGEHIEGGFLLETLCPGEDWFRARERVPDAVHERLKHDLGRMIAGVHTVTGPGFGYPAGSFAPLDGSWRRAFGAIMTAMFDDAERTGAWLPLPLERIRKLTDRAAWALDAVTVPALVHFDLWPGNILLSGVGDPAGIVEITGIIDGERMIWADPLAEFPSIKLGDDIGDDSAVITGYRAGGGVVDFGDEAVRVRLALYEWYLYLIMLVETVPRGVSEEDAGWVRDFVGEKFERAREVLEAA